MSRGVASLHCLFSYDNKLGGSVHAALNVCKYLAEGGQPVEVVAPYAEGDDIAYLGTSYPQLTCHRVARSFPKRYANSRELGIWLEANLPRFQVVEIHGVWVLATLQAARACLRRGVPYFIRPHGSLDPFDLQKHALLKQALGPVYVQWLLDHAAGIICTAQLEADRLVTYGAKPRRHALPLPVPLAAAAGDGAGFRARHGIPADAQVVLFLSRVDYKKGLDFLVPALGRLKREFPRLWFVLAGAGTPEFTRRVHAWLDAADVRGFTREVGFVSGQEKQDAFAAADLFALPSLNENFGIVNIEAMHAGLPLLISDQVYINREIAAADAGVICQPEVNSVTTHLRAMLSGQVELRAMGERGRALVQECYRPEAATKALIDLYARTVHPR
jgi:glycosyltransferase involved in cell wall biosynthesis